MPTFLTPDLLLALAKITALLLIIFALAPFLKNSTHRARLLACTILALPIVFFSSFSIPIFEVIPLEIKSKPTVSPTLSLENKEQMRQLIYGDLLARVDEAKTTVSSIEAHGSAHKVYNPTESQLFPYPQPGISTDPNHEARKFYKTPAQLFDPQAVSLPQSQSIPSPSPLPAPTSPEPDNSAWFIFIAIQGTVLALLPLLISSFRILRLTKSEALDPPLALWKEIHRHSRKTPRLSFTPSPAAPFACGLFVPRVILPDDSPTWPLRRIKSTLLHEAEHLRRRDPLVRFLSTLIRAAFWFHPLVWLAHRQLIAAQEQACDQAALTHGIPPIEYAEELLGSVSHSHLTPSEALSMAKWSQLGNRVRRVLQPPKPTKMKTVILTSAIALIATLALTSIGFSQEPTTQDPPKLISEVSLKKAGRGAILDRNNNAIVANDKDEKRTYPYGKALGHVSGYAEQPDGRKPNLFKGVSGLEKAYNGTLAQGIDVKVTIDCAIQKYCYDLLAKQEFPGSIIIQDPNSGEIISMVSYPSFDPHVFFNPGFAIVFDDPRDPTLNRSISPHTPGSVSKLFSALAGEHAGLNNPEIHCKGFIKIGNIKIRDWKTSRDELFHIPGALEQSCNTYFMELAIQTGADSINKVGQLLHLNESPLAEFPGTQSRYQAWPVGGTPTRASLAMTAIGQSLVSLTPLHVNALTSSIASGSWNQPHLVSAEPKSNPSVPLIGQGEITKQSLKVIREGMHLAIHGDRGTAKRAVVPGLQLAGKTGTAQVGRGKMNNWFTGFGPYEKPKYSVTIFLEGAEGGGKFAAPIAAEVFKKLLAEDK